MKTWFDWMDRYYEPVVQEIADCQETEQLKNIVLERLNAPTRSVAHPIHRGFRKATMLIAAAVLIGCVGMGALAAVGFPWNGTLDQYFGPGAKEETTELGMPGEGLELSVTDEGCTLTLNGALFDGEKLYLPVTLSFEENIPNSDWNYYAMGMANYGGGNGSSVLPDENPGDDKVDLMCTLRGSELESGMPITWKVEYLYANCTDAEGNTQTVWEREGTWVFSFVVPEAKQVIEWTAPDGTTDPVTGIEVEQVRLTPMRVSVVFDDLPGNATVRDVLSKSKIVLCFADGTTRSLAGWEEGLREAQGSADPTRSPIGKAYYEVCCEYGEFIDPAQIVAVELNGCKISAQ